MKDTMTAVTVPIRELRLAHNLTQEELQRRIDDYGVTVSVSALSNVERGKKRASKRLLTAWAQALGVEPLDVNQSEVTAVDTACEQGTTSPASVAAGAS